MANVRGAVMGVLVMCAFPVAGTLVKTFTSWQVLVGWQVLGGGVGVAGYWGCSWPENNAPILDNT